MNRKASHSSLSKRLQAQLGFSLPEVLVASTILFASVMQSAKLYNTSIQGMHHSQLRDGIDAAIHADLEQVRQQVFEWSQDSTTQDGQLSYSPPSTACQNHALASQLISDLGTTMPATNYFLNLSGINTSTDGITITRTITADSSNGNLLTVTYSSTSNINKSTTLLPTAQGWCP